VEALLQVQFFLEDRDQPINAHSIPDLCLDCIGTRSEKALDQEILFDPLEQFQLPAIFEEPGNGQRWRHKVVRQINEKALCLGIEIADTTQPVWIIPSGCRRSSGE